MDVSAALAADLALLTEALDDPGVDLERGLRALGADVKRAVASYTGMTMTIALDGRDVSFTVHDDGARRVAGTSLLIPLRAVTDVDAASTLLLYADTPGAFVDLAADLGYVLGIEPDALVMDRHLGVHPPGLAGFGERVAVNQAIGVLIGRGHTPETALQEIHRLAALDHGNLRAAAESLVRSAVGEPTNDDA